jgi:hypothetical protein
MIGSFLAGAGGVAFVLIGAAAFVAPEPASTQYGLPTGERTALALIRALGARDVVLGVTVLSFLAMRERGPLALVLAVSALAALGDAVAVTTGRDDTPRQNLAIHIGGGAALLLAAGCVRAQW